MWLAFDALLSVYGSARAVEAELAHPVVWDFVRTLAGKRYAKEPDRWLPAPMRRHHYTYGRNRYLTDPAVARELGLMDADGSGSWTHPDLTRMLHADSAARSGTTQQSHPGASSAADDFQAHSCVRANTDTGPGYPPTGQLPLPAASVEAKICHASRLLATSDNVMYARSPTR
jgi:hypothetical protein